MTNRGALALADWVGDQPVYCETSAALRVLAGSDSCYLRWLEGCVLPGEAEREEIGRITDGAVTGAMWDEAVAPGEAVHVEGLGIEKGAPEENRPVEIGMDGGGVDETGVAEFDPWAKPSAALLCELGGPLGTMPSGPAFRAILDPVRPGLFVLAGPGVALVLDEPLGWALRDAVTIGLQDMHADRPDRSGGTASPRVARIG